VQTSSINCSYTTSYFPQLFLEVGADNFLAYNGGSGTIGCYGLYSDARLYDNVIAKLLLETQQVLVDYNGPSVTATVPPQGVDIDGYTFTYSVFGGIIAAFVVVVVLVVVVVMIVRKQRIMDSDRF